MIHDKFTKLKVSRQRKYQMRHWNNGLCVLCPADSFNGNYCETHWVLERLRAKPRLKNQERITKLDRYLREGTPPWRGK